MENGNDNDKRMRGMEDTQMFARNRDVDPRIDTPRMGGESATARRAVRTHEKREHKAKSRYYRMKHGQAKEEFRRIGGVSVENEEEAIAVLRKKLKTGTYDEVARLVFAAAHFCWACDEKGEEGFVDEEAHGNEDAGEDAGWEY